jgi:hypothetical protein
MKANKNKELETIVQSCALKMKEEGLAPWKVEKELERIYAIESPQKFNIAALCRQRFVEDLIGEKFRYITVPHRAYKESFLCEKDDIAWELDARDEDRTCPFCGADLKSLGQYAPLVANYIGGSEAYFSYAGQIDVKGDIQKRFTNLLVYGTGLGPIGVTRGSYLVNKLGGADVKVAEFARAVRCLGFIFPSEALRGQAIECVEVFLPKTRKMMQEDMSDFDGRIYSIDFDCAETERGFILYVEFGAEFFNFRGHGAISHAVGSIKKEIEDELRAKGIEYKLSVIAQGHDGDLKPSPRNKRGRYASAEVRIPASDFEELLKVAPEKFLSFVEVDRVGAQRLGCQFYSGMGGEILPAIYKATKVNPHSALVSCFQNIWAGLDRGDVVYKVELPNVEVGIVSCREGLISPVGREAMRIMDIRSAREFAASVVAQVLAGEFNLALEISQEKLYS